MYVAKGMVQVLVVVTLSEQHHAELDRCAEEQRTTIGELVSKELARTRQVRTFAYAEEDYYDGDDLGQSGC